MENANTYYIDLIVKYFDGEVSSEEMMLLSNWMLLNPENQKIFNDYKKTWELISESSIDKSVDVDFEWNKFAQKNIQRINNEKTAKIVSFNEEVKKSNSFKQILRIAAVILVLAVPSFLLYNYFSQEQTVALFAENQSIQKSLSDGSRISLKVGATLNYPETFDKKQRNVSLKGEAFFEVKHNSEQPFVISAGNIRIEVLGTKFYVNTEALDNKVEVILESGKVAVYYVDKPNEKIIMVPGDKVEVSKNEEHMSKELNSNENYIAWKTKNIVFNDNTLSEVVSILNNVYNCKLKIKDKKISNCRLTAKFEGQPLESVLSVISETLDLKFEKKADEIEIKGIGCE